MEYKEFSNKIDLFNYLNSGIDKSGNLKKEGGFKKHYPIFYNEYSKTIFPEEIDKLPFKQKLWHFLNDNYIIPKCKICGNNVSFETRKNQWGYHIYCSGDCAMHDESVKQQMYSTKELLYGDRKYNNKEKLIETLSKQTTEEKRKIKEKSTQTRLLKNNGKYFSDESINKIKETTYNRYGVDSFTKTQIFRDLISDKQNDIQSKQYKTKKKNNSFNSSKIENELKKYFIENNINYIPQYQSDEYPFACDFYFPDSNYYVEIQGTWTHGSHPFDNDNIEDVKILNDWKNKSKESDFYKKAIYVWTDHDVKKRNIAKENGINYLEIFDCSFNVCLEQLTLNKVFDIKPNFIVSENQLVEWCLKNPFPGNKKWQEDHPIWKCYVPGQQSPYNAWFDEKCVRKAVKNMFWILNKTISKNKYDNFVKRHLDALNSCVIEDGNIIDSDKLLLELVLSRFTIAKIACKVTAISPTDCMKIFDESGIDLRKYNGIYAPMAGFGGIVEGYKRWIKKNDPGEYINKISGIEAYDINKSFCDWYGWSQRDILETIVETDKVCIVCPPFGKNYEHWVDSSEDGISQDVIDDMADITFIEWYDLIKKHVKAPAYIIIGPELSSNGRDIKKCGNLFKKRVGIQLWTDELYERLQSKEERINEGIKD
jgi:hypothetical protein